MTAELDKRVKFIEQWCVGNPNLSKALVIQSCENFNLSDFLKNQTLYSQLMASSKGKNNNKKNILQICPKDRKKIHHYVINGLLSIKNNISHSLYDIQFNIKQLLQQPLPKNPQIIYDYQYQNMDSRKLFFVQLEISKIKLEILNIQYSKLTDLLTYIDNCLSLFSLDLPDDYIYYFDAKALSLTLMSQTNDSPIIQKKNHLKSLIALQTRLTEKINEYKKPLWYTDSHKSFHSHVSNYKIFMKYTVNHALTIFNHETSYFPPINEETSLSKCFFNYDSPFVNKIDEVVCDFDLANNAPTSYMEKIMDLVIELVKMGLPSFKSSDAISAALLIIYRVVFNRMYEKNEKLFSFYNHISIDFSNNTSKIVSNFKMSCMDIWPYDLLPFHNKTFLNQIENNVKENARANFISFCKKEFSNHFVKDVFLNDNNFIKAIEDILKTSFQINPIDQIYCMNSAVSHIQEGASQNREKIISTWQIHSTPFLCFDDLFSLLLGTVISSDCIDIFRINQIIQKYSQPDNLSAPLEFIKTSIEALVSHFTSIQNK